MYEIDYYAMNLPQQPSPPPVGPWPLVVLSVAMILCLLIAAFFYRSQIGDLTQAYAAQARQKEIEAKQNALYKERQEAVTTQLEEATEELNSLGQAARQVTEDFEATFGVPLDTAHLRTTRRIDFIVLKSPTFARLWAQTVSARFAAEDLQDKQEVLDVVRNHLENTTLTESDRRQLLRLQEWMTTVRGRLSDQTQRIVQLRNEMESPLYAYQIKGGLYDVEHDSQIPAVRVHDSNSDSPSIACLFGQ